MTETEDTASARAAGPAPARPLPAAAPRRAWPAVAAAACATFSVVTSEMLPVGLLTPMGEDLSVSAGTAGLAMTAPGLAAAAAAPLTAVAAGRFDRRRLLTALTALLAAADLLSARAPGIGVLVAARILVGVCVGGVWTVAAGLAVRLVPARSVPLATSVVFSGIAAASVLGVPLGTAVGERSGWRTAFAAAGLLSLAAAAALAALLPPLPAERAVPLREVAALARTPRVRTGLAVTAALVTGHFAAYTYVSPVLSGICGVPPARTERLLLLYGAAGVLGTFLAGALSARDPRRTLVLLSAVLAAAAPALPATRGEAAPALVLAVWGLAYGGVSVTAQTWLARAAPRAREAASGLFVMVFNTAIALGAATGGRLADAASPRWTTGAAAALALAATATALVARGSRADAADRAMPAA